MTSLGSHFKPRSAFEPAASYRLLPFRFSKLDALRYVVTNDAGEHLVVTRDELVSLARHQLSPSSDTYRRLKARHFLFNEGSTAPLDLLALKVRSRADAISNLTALHIFVVTLRCDHSCHYCQVSRVTEDKRSFDMSREHAEKALSIVFASPSPSIKIEFQGGESLLNLDLIRYVVERARVLNETARKDLAFVIATNLTHLDDEVIAFCRDHLVYLSTSLDGPEDIHNSNRPLRGGDSYQSAVRGIERARTELGRDSVSALMTTTPGSLPRVKDIVDEYVRLGFNSIFLRSLSPYGFAVRTSLVRRYDIHDWIEFYKEGLAHILEWNRRGAVLREDFASILLQKMFLPTGTNYVDLQSPAGIGIGALIYNYDGAIYASDEGRMLAEMSDTSFRIGHVDNDSFHSLMEHEGLFAMLEESLAESAPMCSDCAFLPYCGAEPVFHSATQKDVVGHKALSAFCTKQMAILRHLITLLEDDADARRILMSWI